MTGSIRSARRRENTEVGLSLYKYHLAYDINGGKVS